MPEASIVIPHYGDVQLLRSCVEAVEKNTADVDYELIVVDNGTGAPDLPGRVIRNATNLGFAAATNQGARAARSEVLVFLNNDAAPTAGWLSKMLQALHADDSIAVVGCKVVFPDGAIQHAGTSIVERHDGILRGFNELDDLPRRMVPAVTAASMVIRKEVFDAVGGFDERYWNTYEDVDLCLKVGEAGWKILYEPDAVVVHLLHQGGTERWTGIRPGRALFHERWVGKVEPVRRLPAPAPKPFHSRVNLVLRRFARRAIDRLICVAVRPEGHSCELCSERRHAARNGR